ncbi:MON2 (YNL297C) [Zygosaccharomyces parabailii]|nr:MON2 (YNL297C) [Zygosaccharomyces parabailii]
MAAIGGEFSSFWKQVNAELHALSSESKKRNSGIKNASDKSIEILKVVHSYEELSRHPDFVAPLVMSCSSKNAKLTTISMQCFQKLSAVPCIPVDKLSDVLDAFIEANQLAMDIKLKVLQILPIFFKVYGKNVYGKLCMKLLKCCSDLLQLPNKSSMVLGTASATLQQLIDEIFERLSLQQKDDDNLIKDENNHEVLIGNNEFIKVNVYRADANRLFSDLCSSFAPAEQPSKDVLLDVKNLPVNYGLEILESILSNSKCVFLEYQDLQFLLRIKAVPLLLRFISSSKNFSTVVRSYRCIRLLIIREYLEVLELELEVILSLLTHNISHDSDAPLWKKALSFEIFMELSKDYNLVCGIYMTYDNFADKKHIVSNFLRDSLQLLQTEEYSQYLCESSIVEKMDMPLISTETSALKTHYLHMLDKSTPPPVNATHLIWLMLFISNELSESLSSAALHCSQSVQEEEKGSVKNVLNGMFPGLFAMHGKFLYSTSLDNALFHSLIRAFQKLAHASGILCMNQQLNQCLELFSSAIVKNVDLSREKSKIDPQQGSTVLNTLSETLIGSTTSEKLTESEVERKILPVRVLNQRHVSLFRALISLSMSLGASLEIESWSSILRTWQWVAYYIYGPSADFMENFYLQDVPPPPAMTKSEVISIENSIGNLFESTTSYSNPAFRTLLSALISESKRTLSLAADVNNGEINLHYDEQKSVSVCIYNKIFYIAQIGELAIYNCSRFVNDQKDRKNWTTIMDYLTSLISDRKLESVAFRLYANKILTDIIRKTSIEVANNEDQEARNKSFNILETLVMDSLMGVIDAFKNLEVGKEEIYHGVANAESEILFELLTTLKDLLNEFGDLLGHSWSTVFKIINAPFEWGQIDANPVFMALQDNSSLVNGIIQKRSEMIQVSYEVFKLISDDFLQALPLDVIKGVIDTLMNFVGQELNLNISFSSISQFWLVGDYLRVRKGEEDRGMEAEFIKDIEEGKLEETITSKSSPYYKIYNGLWLYLLQQLVECSKDKRIEVENGAVQTFFRIIDSHSAYFPNWDLLFLVVVKPLLTDHCYNENLAKGSDFWSHTLPGLVKLYRSNFSNFTEHSSAVDEWLILLDALQHFTSSDATELAYVAIQNYRNLLEFAVGIDCFPAIVLNKCIEIWCGYHIVYGDITGSNEYSSKTGYDCIEELVTGFPFLYQIMMKHDRITVEFMEKTLSLFYSAVRYPLLPEHTRDNRKPSSLQLAVLRGLNTFKTTQKSELEVLVLLQLSVMVTLPLDTREKIEKKLLPKLSKSQISRIPTFEAICYDSFEELNRRLHVRADLDFSSASNKKIMLRVLKNLGEMASRKSLIDLSPQKDNPIWILSSQCFRDLFLRMFDSFTLTNVSEKKKESFFSVFINVAISSLQKHGDYTDAKTEVADLVEYGNFRDIMLREDVIKFIEDSKIEHFISAVWNCSFLFETDEVEKEMLKHSKSLLQVAENLSTFDFSDISGCTVENPLFTKHNCALACLEDLLRFIQIPGDNFARLRRLSAPFLVSRVAFVLRRYVSNESLVRRAPIPKVRKMELEILLPGLHHILDLFLTDNRSEEHSVIDALKLLHPLILRAIPLSHKMNVLQYEVMELSLGFTKLSPK